MIELRAFKDLGRFENDWLKSRFHFSFAEYTDPERMAHGPLRVWNDDIIVPGGGFAMHSHRDMEIITYVRRGAITHEDHLGNKGRTEAGDVQVMHAGTGIQHSEYNHEAEPAEIFQIWILPASEGGAPGWAAREFPKADRSGALVTLASGRPGASNAPSAPSSDGDEALPINQDASMLAATLNAGQSATHDIAPGRRAYLVVAAGAIEVNGVAMNVRDGAAIEDEASLAITARADSEIILIDLP
ncbi:MAG TPA: pirin family protein [Alphaproteobacteria bacterium]|nr:pirin family protein [Alphaproteobacteria bacterium]